MAQVEFVDELVRRQLVERLRASLQTSGIQFDEITLLTETPERTVADSLLERLRGLAPGVVSVDGFAASLPLDRQELANSIYRLSFKREPLASTGHRQIWWVPPYLAKILERIAPDLESWILLKLKLAETASALGLVGSAKREAWGSGALLEVIPSDSLGGEDPQEARRRAADAFSRFQRAIEQGTTSSEAFETLMVPAIELMRRADLAREARELELQIREYTEQQAIRRIRQRQPDTKDAAEPQIDVFISYTARDRAWAKWLDFVLREAGYETKVQVYDFKIGESFVGAIDVALKQCRWVACLLSPAYLESRWCREEWQVGLFKDRLFGLRIADCDVGGLLGTRAYLDLVGVPEAEAQEQILAELAKRNVAEPRPTMKPSFPGGAATHKRPQFPASVPPIWNIIEERNRFFTGRDELLYKLHEALSAGETTALTQAIRGLGGVGKTQLALEYAYRYASEYDGVWWLHAEEPAALARDYAELAPHLGVAQVVDQGQMVREVHQALSQRKRILLIFDNATEPSSIKAYLPLGAARHVIVTTRTQTWAGANAQDVTELSLNAAIEFLLKRSGQDDRAAAGDVAKRLGCLPLALEQAAAYVETCHKPLRDYAALLQKHGLELLEKGQPYQYERTVGTSWALAFEQVQSRCPAAADLLNFCAFMAPEAIHMRDLAGAGKHLPERLAKLFTDELALDEAKATLLSFSLIRAEGETISIHQLVQDVTRSRMTPDVRDRWLTVALRAVNALFPDDSQDVRTWPVCSRWLAHVLVLVSWDWAAELDAIACGRLLNQAGLHLKGRADFGRAEPLYRRALAIGETDLGHSHPNVAIRLTNLADLLRDTNRLSEAEPLYRRAVEIWETTYGAQHPQVATGLTNLALLFCDTNRLGEAEPLYRCALAIDEASYGPNHPDVARDLNNLASLLGATNRPGEAEPLYRRALRVIEASHGSDHPLAAIALNNLASLLGATNRPGEAEPLYRRALAIDDASFGPNHPKVAIRLNNLALLLSATNRLTEAERLYRRAFSIVEASFGSDHPSTITVRGNLGVLLAQMATDSS